MELILRQYFDEYLTNQILEHVYNLNKIEHQKKFNEVLYEMTWGLVRDDYYCNERIFNFTKCFEYIIKHNQKYLFIYQHNISRFIYKHNISQHVKKPKPKLDFSHSIINLMFELRAFADNGNERILPFLNNVFTGVDKGVRYLEYDNRFSTKRFYYTTSKQKRRAIRELNNFMIIL